MANVSGNMRIALKMIFLVQKFFYVRLLVFEIWSILYAGDFACMRWLMVAWIKIDHISKTKSCTKKNRPLKNHCQSNAHLSCKFSHCWTTYFCKHNLTIYKLWTQSAITQNIKIGEIRNMIFHSIQHCEHLSCKYGHFWGKGEVCLSFLGTGPRR